MAADPSTRRLSVFAFVSGAAGLVYQSLWLRSFGLVFGNTTDAVAAVLATFMGGLALGSAVAGRRRAVHPLAAYAWCELGIGAAALLTIPLLRLLPALAGGSGGFARAAGSALVVLPATLLMGATIPLLVAERARAQPGFPASFGRLYRVNTVGAAFGVLAGGFVLVPALGTTVTLALAALANVVIGLAARRAAGESAPIEAAGPPPERAPSAIAGASLPLALALLSGFASFALEVIWTRAFALVIGSSVYAFDAMLLAFLCGLALGAWVFERMGARVKRPAVAAGIVYVAVGVLGALTTAAVGWLPIAFLALMGALPMTFAAHQTAAFALCFAAMLPVTAALGFAFPLLSRMVDDAPQRAAGRLYAWNTAGAILGAVAAAVVLVPRLGLQRSATAAAGVALLAGLLAAFRDARPALRWIPALAGAVVVALLVPRWQPWNRLVAASGVYKYGLEWKDTFASATELPERLARDREILFYEEGKEAVVAVTQSRASGRRFLSINGKTDAGSGAQDVLTQKFLGHVPLLLHPRPRTVLVIGWGAGATAAATALHPVESIECVEIEPATWRAAPLFDGLNGKVRNDPRFRLVVGDGRNHLLSARGRYDVVISEPSNPWITGVSNLFTREFLETARGRLAEGGVFGQWFHYYNLREEDVKVEVRTFLSVFPHASLWLVPPIGMGEAAPQLAADLLLVGSATPHTLDHPRLRAALAGAVGEDLRATGALGTEAAVLASYGMGRADLERWAGPGVLNTDAFPHLEFQAPRSNVMPRDELVKQTIALFEALGGTSAEILPPLSHSALAAGGGAGLASAYEALATEHARLLRPERARLALVAAVAADPRSASAQAALGDLLIARGRAPEAEPHLRAAVELDPGDFDSSNALAGLYLEQREMDKAERAHRDLVRHHPEYVPGHLRLGAILARRGAWAESRAELKEAQRLDPQAPVDPALLAYLDQQAAAPRR
jgi:spermidine synthase